MTESATELSEVLDLTNVSIEAVREAVQRGLRLLAQRPRTEAELRERLASKHDGPTVEAAIARLCELGYVDDTAWAAFYVAQRRAEVRSARLLALEIERRGVAREVARTVVATHDDDSAAERVARETLKRLGSQTQLSPLARRRRLLGRLARRGFGAATIERALAAVEADAQTTGNRLST